MQIGGADRPVREEEIAPGLAPRPRTLRNGPRPVIDSGEGSVQWSSRCCPTERNACSAQHKR